MTRLLSALIHCHATLQIVLSEFDPKGDPETRLLIDMARRDAEEAIEELRNERRDTAPAKDEG